MKERPILFSGAMVRAILEGRKTQTRRVMNPQPTPHFTADVDYWTSGKHSGELGRSPNSSPYGKPGDRLWVRETFMPMPHLNAKAFYRASDPLVHGQPWKPSIFMPRALSRITLEVVGVRLERLQEVSREDAIAEGIDCDGGDDEHRNRNSVENYAVLWDSINGKRPGCAWANNPWVWVVEFKRI